MMRVGEWVMLYRTPRLDVGEDLCSGVTGCIQCADCTSRRGTVGPHPQTVIF